MSARPGRALVNLSRALLLALAVAFLHGLPSRTLVRPTADELKAYLEIPIVPLDSILAQVKTFIRPRVAKFGPPPSLEVWNERADHLRREVVSDIVLRGEAAKWALAPLRVEWGETLAPAPEYEIRKLRYEALPGLWVPAALYVPTNLEAPAPVALNVNGHEEEGMTAPYKQLRCINQAKRGVIVLNVEWLGTGQLRTDDFNHYRMNQLELCGTSGLAPFFLSIKRALDVLLSLEGADPTRVAVAGLSGGGWQTILISALDTRVTLANPVAGYSSSLTRIDHHSDLGDSEQAPTDLAGSADYLHLTAMMAPRALLLTHNKEDRCCFDADHALRPLLEAAESTYLLHGADGHLRFHVNRDPGSHNFDRDNREALYRFMRDIFYDGSNAFATAEIESEAELLDAEEFAMELPADNLDFNTLARRLAADLPRAARPPADGLATKAWRSRRRDELRELIRWKAYEVEAESAESRLLGDVTARRWTLRMGEDWTLGAVELEPPNAEATVLLIGEGGAASLAGHAVAALAERTRVIVFDPLYWGHASISARPHLFALLIASVKERLLGLQASQIGAAIRWAESRSARVRVRTIGRRAHLAALVARAAGETRPSDVSAEGQFRSLKEIIEENISVDQAPELFCFGLLESFDIPQLEELAKG